jgi:putative tryptophan/tyrosine transport system substrate-binding protein
LVVKRREFIKLLGGTAGVWPLRARAQQADQVRRVGLLVNSAESDPAKQSELGAFRARLEELGWSEGRNIRFDYFRSDSQFNRLSVNAKEFVSLAPAACGGCS